MEEHVQTQILVHVQQDFPEQLVNTQFVIQSYPMIH
jgi:hypothetical protein